MAEPTCLPSATRLAASIAHSYEIDFGESLPPKMHADLEALSEYLYERGELRRAQIARYVKWGPFQRNPNRGHLALADLLICGALKASATTNFDTHIEDGAAVLGEDDLIASIDAHGAGVDGRRYSPFLKPHGCCRRDRENTLWIAQQLDEDTLRDRIAGAKTWLAANLLEGDLLFVGFWTDWNYLNEILKEVVTLDRRPRERLVVIVDPAEPTELQAKAPELWRWANENESDAVHFIHVRESGSDFLDELRAEVSTQFLRHIWSLGGESFSGFTGRTPPESGDWAIPSDTTALYALRRDVTGAGPDGAVESNSPANCSFVGAFHLRLLEMGASVSGPVFSVPPSSYRVFNATDKFISQVRAVMERSGGLQAPVDYVICVGAEHDHAAANVVRPQPSQSIVRPQPSGAYLTTEEAWEVLGKGGA